MNEKTELEVLAEIRDLLLPNIIADHKDNPCGDMLCSACNYECVLCVVKQFLIQYKDLQEKLKKIDASIGMYHRPIGNYNSYFNKNIKK